jgi:hypothetical protein
VTDSIPKTTFASTVIGVIRAFVDLKKSFSAKDVTDEVRELDWHLGKIDKLETGTIFVKGKEVAIVNHKDVRSIVHRYFNEGYLVGYDRSNDNGYWLYAPAAVATPPIPGADYDGSSIL